MATLHEAQEDYIKHWKKNAEQHFKDGDYDWIASCSGEQGFMNQEFELCIRCNKPTPYHPNTPITLRRYYVEGSG